MDFLSIFLIALGLGMDAFAVAIGTGVTIRKLSFGPVSDGWREDRIWLHSGV
jgi:putative Mn2+ efflux pump MntP